MLKIRLQRIGKKNSPSYRVVLVEHTAPPKGKFLEILGFYNPRKKQKNLKIDRIKYWLSKGVQVSPTINNLLVDEKIKEKKVKAWKPKKRKTETPVVTKEEKKPAETSVETPKPEEPKVEEKKEVEIPKEQEKPEEIKPEQTNP